MNLRAELKSRTKSRKMVEHRSHRIGMNVEIEG